MQEATNAGGSRLRAGAGTIEVVKLAPKEVRRLVRQLASPNWQRSTDARKRLRGSTGEALAVLERMVGGPSARSQLVAAWALGSIDLRGPAAHTKRAEHLLVALARRRDRRVVAAAVGAIGAHEMVAAGSLVLRLPSSHPAIAYSLARALPELRPPGFERKLLALLRSRTVKARDWAAFGLAQGDADSPAIRRALLRTATRDPDAETRGEALIGLARRHDPRVRPLIVGALRARFRGVWPVDAAIEYPDSAYVAELLAAYQRLRPRDVRAFEDQFLEAIWAASRLAEKPPVSARTVEFLRFVRRRRSRR